MAKRLVEACAMGDRRMIDIYYNANLAHTHGRLPVEWVDCVPM